MKKKLAPIAEQLVLSGLSLLINIAFIAVSSKEEYGVFSILNSYLLLAVSLQTAVFSVPVTVELSRFNAIDKKRSLVVCSWALLPIAFGLALLSALTLYGYFQFNKADNATSLCISFAAAIFTTWIREFSRTLNVLQGNFSRSFGLAMLYSTLVVGAIGFSIGTTHKLTTVEIFWFISIASLLASPDLLLKLKERVSTNELIQIQKLLVPNSKWAFPGVVTTWIQNNAYLTIVGGLAGVTATADLSAARLFIMPYMTGFAGFGRTLIKSFSEDLDKTPEIVKKQATKLAVFQVAIGLSLATIIYALTVFNIGDLLGKYSQSLNLAIWWACFAGVACAKSIFVMLAQSGREFKLLFGSNLAAAAVVLATIFSPYDHEITKLAIFALIAGEAVTLAIVWVKLKNYKNTK
jgi:O-antigen/teichoic acid export membrane protein